jgi:tetratricopeptide (TPR) repeat protein
MGMVSELAYQGKKPTFEEAIALYNSGDAATARPLFEALLVEEPLSVPLLVSLGMSCWQLGDYRNAEDYLEKAIAIQPRNESAFRALGMLYNSTNNLEKAIKALNRCVELSPGYAQGWLALGLVQQRIDLLNEAEYAYNQALQIHPRYVEALNNLATIKLARKEYDATRSLIYRSLAEKPNHVDSYRTLARLYREVGVDSEALILLKRAVRIDPQATHAWNELGSIYRDMSDTPKSIAAYKKAVEAFPGNVDAKANLTCILSTDGSFEESRALCDELLTVQPDQMGVRFRKAIVIPAIMDTVEQTEESRAQILAELDDLANHPGQVTDPLGQIGATNFYLAYHGRNDREIQEKTSQTLLKICPTLDYIAPHIGRARKPGKIRIGVCSRHLSRHTIGVLWGEYFARLDRDRFEIYLFHTLPVFNGVPKGLRDRVDKEVRIPLRLEDARKIIANFELDVMYYTDIGMEPLTWFLSFARLAPVH